MNLLKLMPLLSYLMNVVIGLVLAVGGRRGWLQRPATPMGLAYAFASLAVAVAYLTGAAPLWVISTVLGVSSLALGAGLFCTVWLQRPREEVRPQHGNLHRADGSAEQLVWQQTADDPAAFEPRTADGRALPLVYPGGRVIADVLGPGQSLRFGMTVAVPRKDKPDE